MTVDPASVSVVVQGPVIPHLTTEVIASVRQYLPGAEVILSTWKGSDLSELTPDVLVENDDPGPIPTPGKTNNVNRQIVSTRNGLARASRPYAMKLRSDTMILRPESLDWFARSVASPRPKEPRVFQERILTCRHFTRNPERSPWLFHPSDIFMLGLREDLIRLWNVRLVTGPPTFPTGRLTSGTQLALKPRTQTVFGAIWWCQEYEQAPEQYLWLACLRRFAGRVARKTPIRIPSPSNLWLSERSLLANFYTAETDDLGIRLPPRIAVGEFGFKISRPSTCYSNDEWERLSAVYAKNPRPFSRGVPTLCRQVVAMLRDEHIHRLWGHMLFNREGAIRRRIRSLFRGAVKAK